MARNQPTYQQTCAIHAPGVICDNTCPGFLNAAYAEPEVGAVDGVDDEAEAEVANELAQLDNTPRFTRTVTGED